VLYRLVALRRSHVGALELPRHEAMRVEMAVPDLRCPVESLDQRLLIWRGGSSKFEFELHLANRHWITTYGARRPCAPEAEYAARLGYWQSAALDRFAGFLPDDWLVGHGASSVRTARPRVTRDAHHVGNSDGRRVETLCSDVTARGGPADCVLSRTDCTGQVLQQIQLPARHRGPERTEGEVSPGPNPRANIR